MQLGKQVGTIHVAAKPDLKAPQEETSPQDEKEPVKA